VFGAVRLGCHSSAPFALLPPGGLALILLEHHKKLNQAHTCVPSALPQSALCHRLPPGGYAHGPSVAFDPMIL